MNHVIRHAVPEDLAQICGVENACFPPAEAATEDAFRTRLKAFPERFLVAEVQGQIVGLINGCCTTEPVLEDALYEPDCPHRPDNPWQTVFGLAVLPEYQGMGIAGALMEALTELCIRDGQRGIVLTCKKEKIPMYEHFGFSCRGVSGSVHGGALWYDMVKEL